MLLKCDVQVNNRLIPPQNQRGQSKCCRGAIELYRKSSNDKKDDRIYNLVVYSNKSKNGTKYKIKENILQVFSRFTENGRATISFKEPQHDIWISKASPHDLKRFLLGIKLGFKGQDVPGISMGQKPISHQDMLEKTKPEMKILSRQTYPLQKSFPLSLEKLTVNHCQLQKFDCRMLKLMNLNILNLSENYLKELPESLDSLVNLKELYLSSNRFTNMPICLFNPVIRSSLRLLDMSSNLLEAVPYQLCWMENLTNLQLDNNKINMLPNNIGMLKSLRYLSVAHNCLTYLPYEFSILNIDSLDLSRNPFGTQADNPIKSMNISSVPTLFEIVARTITNKSIHCGQSLLPKHILQYLKTAKVCLCHNVCFESHAIYTSTLDLGKVAHTVTADNVSFGRMNAPVEGYLCSWKCYYKWLNNPNAIWK
eukprot:gene6988-7773_t